MKSEDTFELEKGILFFILLRGVPMFFLIYCISIVLQVQFTLFSLLVLAPLVILNFFLGKIYHHSKYIIRNKTLITQMGRFKTQINISEINFITKGKYPAAGNRPALSLNGIKINYGMGNSIFLSPEEVTSFTTSLVELNPEIELRGF